MKKLTAALAIVLGLMLVYVVLSERREREMRESVQLQISELATSVDRLTDLVERVLQENRMGPEVGEQYTSWWSGSPPELIEVRTVREPNESQSSYDARHDAAVAAKRAESPPL